jgi:hypothetical protein
MSVISHEYLKSNYDAVEPLNGFIVAEVTEKPSERILASGIIIPDSVEDEVNDRPFLIVRKMSKEASEKFPSVKAGDIVEVLTGGRDVTFVWGHEMEGLAIIDSKHVAAFYTRHADATPFENPPKQPTTKLKLV